MSLPQRDLVVICTGGKEMAVGVEYDFVHFSNLIPNGMQTHERCVLPLSEINQTVFEQVLAWYEHHKETVIRISSDSSASLEQCDEIYFGSLPITDVFDLVYASNYLSIDTLFYASCKAVARALMRCQTSATSGSDAIRDYIKITTAIVEGEMGLNSLKVNHAVCRVCLIPELRDQIALERSRLENESLKQDWKIWRGRMDWNRPIDQGLGSSTFDNVTSLPMERTCGGSKAQALLDQENLWLKAELERLRLELRLEIHRAFERFSNRSVGSRFV